MKKTLHLIFVLTFLVVSAAQTQKPSRISKPSSVTAYKLVAIKVTGTERYTEKEILPASGLQLGQSAAEGDFKEAVQRLGDTGLFIDVVYSFSYSGTGTKLELQLADTDKSKLVPAHFENFVWFTDAELLSELQRRVPLFKQVLPVAGNLPDRVSEALQAILTEKQFPGRVDYLRQGKQDGGDLTGIAYRVDEVSIRIRKLEFPGATPEQTALLTTAARRVTGADYARSALATVAQVDLLPVYWQRGYLRASFGASDARVAKHAPGEQASGDIEVDAIVPVTPGKVYATSGVAWKGNSVVPSEALAHLMHLPMGQPADAVGLVRDLEGVRKTYRSRGYMAVQIKPDPKIDDDQSTVHYDLNIVEGDQYKMGELEIVGLDTQAKARLREAWTLPEGQPYNADYPKQFVEATGRLLPPGVRWAISIHEAVDAKDKTVDVTIQCKAN